MGRIEKVGGASPVSTMGRGGAALASVRIVAFAEPLERSEDREAGLLQIVERGVVAG